MSEFTREQLEEIAAMSIFLTKPAIVCAQVAAFAIALLDRAEKAEAERDEANAERDDAVDRWARRAREAEATVKDYLTVQAERDRLREDLSKCGEEKSIQESIHDLLTERDRLREELLGAKVAWDMCDAVNGRLREGLREVLRDAGRVMGLLAEHGASILPHLMDDDENPGERLRQAVRRARERAK